MCHSYQKKIKGVISDIIFFNLEREFSLSLNFTLLQLKITHTSTHTSKYFNILLSKINQNIFLIFNDEGVKITLPFPKERDSITTELGVSKI